MIRKVTPAGYVTTLAGSSAAGFADGAGTAAAFNSPKGLAVDSAFNVYVADLGNNRIRKITPAGVVTTLAGSGAASFADGSGSSAAFSQPGAVAIDASGNVYVSDWKNNRVRKITPAGVVTTLAGSGDASFADGAGTTAAFSGPIGISVDTSGNVFVVDYWNQRIRQVSPTGVVTTLAGTGSTYNLVPNDGPGTSATFYYPMGVAFDAAGNLYITEVYKSWLRRICWGQ